MHTKGAKSMALDFGWQWVGSGWAVHSILPCRTPFLAVKFLSAGHALPAGPKITSCFPHLSVYIFICASTLITCAIITSRTLLPCDLASVDFRLLLFVATMSSLAQLQVRDGSRGNVDVTMRG